METIKKNWLTYLGVTFMFTAFIYFLKHAVDHDWLPPVVRVAVGLAIGLSGMFAGLHLYRIKNNSWVAQVLAGLGLAVNYATISYAALSEEVLWSWNTLFIVMVALTGFVTWVSFTYGLRTLSFIGILGGLLTPLFLQVPETHVWMLFFFVFILNAVSLYLSAIMRWTEHRVMSFFVTLGVYLTYYILFDPIDWGQPLFYISTFFVVYMGGLFFASWHNKRDFEGLNMYLGLLNAINYVLWSIFILSNFEVSYAFPMLLTGVIFILMALAMFYASGKKKLASTVFFALGIIVIAIAGGDLGIHYSTVGMKYVVLTSIWMFLIAMVYVLSVVVKNEKLKMGALMFLFALLVHWFFHAWDVEWVMWFGVKYIPFINPGALVWIAFAIIGFYLSKTFIADGKNQKKFLSRSIAIISHLVVGGLFTVQIVNVHDAYDLPDVTLMLTISIMWMLYAILIFLWGMFSKDMLYKSFASIVVIITSLKVFFIDLQGASSIDKVVFLLIIGGMTFLMAFLDKKLEEKIEIKGKA